MKQYLLFLRSVLLFLLLAVGAGQVMADEETPTTYTVSFGSVPAAGGTVTATVGNTAITSGSSVAKGSSVNFTRTINTGYEFIGWYFDAECTGEKIADNAILTLTNLSSNSSVYAKYQVTNKNVFVTTSSEYTITINSGAPNAKAEYGATVNFSVTPADGYFLKVIELKDGSNNAVAFTKQSDGTYSFVMPSSNVTIKAAVTPTVTGTKGTDYTVDDDGNITILKSGLTVTGTLKGNLIIKNTKNAGKMKVTFDNVQTLSADKKWASSIIVSNTGNVEDLEYPQITIVYKGINAFVNSDAPGFIVNPIDGTWGNQDHKPCIIYFDTEGESVLYIGSNNSNYKALYDGLGTSYSLLQSYIKFDNAQFDCLNYSTSTVGQGETKPSWTPKAIVGTKSEFNTFIASCKTSYQFVQFSMNQKTDSRTAPAGWLTICYPYSGTVTNGYVYEVFGRVMWKEGDPEMTESRGELGRLKHLVLTLRNGDDKTKFEAGKPYFIKKKSGQDIISFEIDMEKGTYHDESTNKDVPYEKPATPYTSPVTTTGFVGVYATKTMEPESYFLSGSQMGQVRPNSTQNLIPGYRAYFPYTDDTDNFIANVPEYDITKDGKYLVYGHATGTGGTDSSGDHGNNGTTTQNAKIISINDVVILGEEETTAIMNTLIDNKFVSSGLYDLMGRKVQTPKKGSLYIMNGKKVIY